MNRSFVMLCNVVVGFLLMINSALACQCLESKSVAASVESSAGWDFDSNGMAAKPQQI